MQAAHAVVLRAFLFTDIEGSLRLWERDSKAMVAALELHDAILRNAITGHGGAIFKTVGDAVHAEFPTPTGAVAASVEAQRQLASTTWTEAGLAQPLRVRMALHLGEVEERDGDFAGSVLNRLSRLLAAGHGGQILVAESLAQHVTRTLPGGVELRDLGRRRLRDVPGTEHIFQLDVQGLPTSFPPLKALPTSQHNLPLSLTPCIGRDAERERIRGFVLRSGTRLITLTGPGGIGKTRLALQAAIDLIDEFPDGVWFVDLTAVWEPHLVAGAVARVLGVREEAGLSVEDSLTSWIAERSLLLVLDNCEQILDGATHLALRLLLQAPGLRVLATSRVPLAIRGEQRMTIDPLDLPATGTTQTFEEIEETASVRLFMTRARERRSGFMLNAENARHIEEICHRVDGIPLALELAAARLTVLSPAALRERLERRLPLLASADRDRPERHQTMRNAIDWSYQLLPTDEQAVFRRLSVFAGGWALSSVETVVGNGANSTPLDTMISLASQSLIRAEPNAEDEPRFSMLETIREFAVELLAESGEETTIRDRHAQHFLIVAEEHGPALLGGADQRRSLSRLDRDYGNLQASLGWYLEQGDAESMLRLCIALWKYWSIHGPIEDGRRWFERSLSMEDTIAPALKYDALNRLGNISIELDDIDAACRFYEQSLHLAMRHRNKRMIGRNLGSLGMVANLQGRRQDERSLLERGLRLSEEATDRRGIALATLNLAISARDAGDFATALQLHESAIALLRDLGDEDGVAGACYYQGLTLYEMDDLEAAHRSFSKALAAFEQLGDTPGMGHTSYGLGLVALGQGEYATSRALLDKALRFQRQRHIRPYIAECLEGLAFLAVATGDPHRAAVLTGEAAALRDGAGAPATPPRRKRLQALAKELKRSLGSRTYRLAIEAGKSLASNRESGPLSTD